ncbi:MAG: ABC transporter ATP-binding protein [Clostridia bacterium]|nr:ABC transporter ATP-binding protein [Clostridia bacterium]
MKIRISKAYDEKTVFDGLELEITEGEIVCVFGASGVGKTTLLNAVAGVIPFEGSIDPEPKNVGYIFQEPRLLPNLTVEENLAYVGGRYESIQEILQKMEIAEQAKKKPSALSGGEKQRVSIARAFLTGAPLLLLDEPFASLDTALKRRLMREFVGLWREDRPTVLFVTHDLEEGLTLAHRIVVLKDGGIVLDERLQGVIPRKYGECTELCERVLACLEK